MARSICKTKNIISSDATRNSVKILICAFSNQPYWINVDFFEINGQIVWKWIFRNKLTPPLLVTATDYPGPKGNLPLNRIRASQEPCNVPIITIQSLHCCRKLQRISIIQLQLETRTLFLVQFYTKFVYWGGP